MAFVTDILEPRQNQTHILLSFRENIGGRGKINQYFKQSWEKVIDNGNNIINCIN